MFLVQRALVSSLEVTEVLNAKKSAVLIIDTNHVENNFVAPDKVYE